MYDAALASARSRWSWQGEADAPKRLSDAFGGAELVIDALLGTGRARPIEGALAEVLDRCEEARGDPPAAAPDRRRPADRPRR